MPVVSVESEITYRRKHSVWIGLSAGLVLLLAAFLFLKLSGWMLDWILIYETKPAPADVVLVEGLGGILDKSAELFHARDVQAILITTYKPEKYRSTEAPVSLYDLIRERLDELHIPSDAIDHFPHEPVSMLDRQLMLRDQIQSRGYHSYLVFSGRYSSRLVKIRHDDTFPKGDISLVIYPTEGKGVWRKQWLGIQNTLIRMAFWELVYRPEIRRHNLLEDSPLETAS